MEAPAITMDTTDTLVYIDSQAMQEDPATPCTPASISQEFEHRTRGGVIAADGDYEGHWEIKILKHAEVQTRQWDSLVWEIKHQYARECLDLMG